ncbi:hypothetical protein R3P38DRAFT_2933124 [Favolaschia claudopus]|uniref:Uncharacterized protein n=1 Tax=Favolaschia claudopus TaxID=2862362 RepID=A0AAW0BTB0_9AGAR
MFLGSLMSYFWAYKAGEQIEEFAPPISRAMSTQNLFAYTVGNANDLPVWVQNYNRDHYWLKRHTIPYFRVALNDGETVLIPAMLVRLYIKFGIEIMTSEIIPSVTPFGYQDFIDMFHARDASPYYFPHYKPDGRLGWKEGSTVPDFKEFGVAEDQLLDMPVALPGQVVVEEDDYEEGRRAIAAKRHAEIMAFRRRAEKAEKDRSESSGGVPDVHHVDVMAAWHRKRKAVEEDFVAKRARLDGNGGAGGSGGAGSEITMG